MFRGFVHHFLCLAWKLEAATITITRKKRVFAFRRKLISQKNAHIKYEKVEDAFCSEHFFPRCCCCCCVCIKSQLFFSVKKICGSASQPNEFAISVRAWRIWKYRSIDCVRCHHWCIETRVCVFIWTMGGNLLVFWYVLMCVIHLSVHIMHSNSYEHTNTHEWITLQLKHLYRAVVLSCRCCCCVKHSFFSLPICLSSSLEMTF